MLQLQADQQYGDGRRAGDKPAGQAKHDDLSCGDVLSAKAPVDILRVRALVGVLPLFFNQRVFVVMSSGNLATTQLAVSRLRRDAEDPSAARSLRTFRHLFEVAEYVGEVLVASQVQAQDSGQHSGVSTQATLILGGQVAGERPGLYLVYPLGNCIAASPETPYLQIGESKYGKPILDRIIRPETSLEDAARCALVSLDSTIRSNLSVG